MRYSHSSADKNPWYSHARGCQLSCSIQGSPAASPGTALPRSCTAPESLRGWRSASRGPRCTSEQRVVRAPFAPPAGQALLRGRGGEQQRRRYGAPQRAPHHPGRPPPHRWRQRCAPARPVLTKPLGPTAHEGATREREARANSSPFRRCCGCVRATVRSLHAGSLQRSTGSFLAAASRARRASCATSQAATDVLCCRRRPARRGCCAAAVGRGVLQTLFGQLLAAAAASHSSSGAKLLQPAERRRARRACVW